MSNYKTPVSLDSLLQEAEQEDLYKKLIEQLNKDFNFANEPIDVPIQSNATELKDILQEKIFKLIHFKFAEYLNLLYIIDVSEEEVKKLDGSDISELSKQVSFLILKREWQKVWFRNKL